MAHLKKWFVRLLVLVVFVVALLVASDNSDEVRLSFLTWQTPEWPISWWMLGAFVLGTGFGLVLNFFSNTRLRMNVRQANRQISRREKELDAARAGAPK